MTGQEYPALPPYREHRPLAGSGAGGTGEDSPRARAETPRPAPRTHRGQEGCALFPSLPRLEEESARRTWVAPRSIEDSMLSSHGLWDGSIFSYGSPGRLVFRQPWRAERGGAFLRRDTFCLCKKYPSPLGAAVFAAVGLRNTSLRLGENTLRGRRPACSPPRRRGQGCALRGPTFLFGAGRVRLPARRILYGRQAG